MTVPVAISRLRLLTPFGFDTWSALLADRRLEGDPSAPDDLLDPDESLDRSIRLALAVAGPLGAPPDTPLFAATSKGPALTFFAGLDALGAGRPLTEPQARHIALGTGAIGPLLAARLNLRGGVHTSVAACAAGMHALHRAAQAVARGECRRALVVAADASLHPVFTAAFDRLGVLAPPDAGGTRRCTPFDPAGRGFFVAEAAAALLIEAEPAAPPLAWLDHTAIAADSTSLIAIDPDTIALRHALAKIDQPSPASLAFIHAHATGTAHDAHELAAIRALAPDAPVFSHKHWLGHSLGAAGLVSVALSALAHHHGLTPLHTPVPAGARSLTIAQGFGGHIAIATLRTA